MSLLTDPRHATAHRPKPSTSRVDAARIPVGWIGSRRLLAGLDHDLNDHAGHLRVHGAMPRLGDAQLLAELDAVALTGRGGAAFGVAAKVRALHTGRSPSIVVNGTEGEPASAKDHVLLARAPHIVLDGAALLADAVAAATVVVAVTDPRIASSLETAIASRPDRGHFKVSLVADRFLAGEAHALISSLNGGSGLPPGRRVHATERGLGGAPTLLFNAETFAQLAILARDGSAAYAATGLHGSAGTTLLTVSGDIASPGVLEVPLGVELGEVARVVGAAPSQAVVIGGYHGAWLAPDPDLQLSVAGLAAAGGTLGAGAVIFVGDDTCPVAELSSVARWLAGESAKQCGPCAFGLPALADDLAGVLSGSHGAGALVAARRHSQLLVGRGACSHPDGAVRFVSSGLALLAADVDQHLAHGRCGRAGRGDLALSRAAAMTPRRRAGR